MWINQLFENQTVIMYHGSKSDPREYKSRVHTGTNSHAFGSYETDRHGVFFTHNIEVAKLYGTPHRFEINVDNTLVSGSPLCQHIYNEWWMEIGTWAEDNFTNEEVNGREVRMDFGEVIGGRWPEWHLFEEDLGLVFTALLEHLGHDSFAFEEYIPGDNDEEVFSKTLVVLDPRKVRHLGEA
jgi:hypothetical protein